MVDRENVLVEESQTKKISLTNLFAPTDEISAKNGNWYEYPIDKSMSTHQNKVFTKNNKSKKIAS